MYQNRAGVDPILLHNTLSANGGTFKIFVSYLTFLFPNKFAPRSIIGTKSLRMKPIKMIIIWRSYR